MILLRCLKKWNSGTATLRAIFAVMRSNFLFISCFILLASCSGNRIHERNEWGEVFNQHKITDGCLMIRDHAHEEIYYYNKQRCTTRFTPASTFKIFNSLVGLETAIAPDDQYVIKWDGVVRRPEWDHDMTMREAFKVSNVPYYQELARRIGRNTMQHYLDTVQYGNRTIGKNVDQFWLDNSLQISADEQVGFIKKLYFDELPFSERVQRIVRSMMLREEKPEYKLYYKTGTNVVKDSAIYWIVGIVEVVEHVKEHEKSMNKSNQRNYPYFFAENFSIAASDTTKDWSQARLEILKEILYKMDFINSTN